MSQITAVYNLAFNAGVNWRSESVSKENRKSAMAILNGNPRLENQLTQAWKDGFNAGFDSRS